MARETRPGVLYDFGTASALDVSPDEREKEFRRRWAKGGTNFLYGFTDHLRNPESNEFAANFVRKMIAETVDDTATAKLLTPVNYPIGTKRICIDTDYYATFNRENTHIVDVKSDPIAAISEAGLQTESGTSYPLDVLVFATGFDAITGALLAIDIRTSDGASLRQEWVNGPMTYLGMNVAGFPNLFLVTGPGSPSVLSNMVLSIEFDVEWICNCITDLKVNDMRMIEASEAAQYDWKAQVDEAASGTLYDRADSWFRGANVPGKPRVFMPYVGGVNAYQNICREVAADGYRGFILQPAHGAQT
jgi:cyclohexanone monooxygenase